MDHSGFTDEDGSETIWEYAFATYVHFDPYFVLGTVKQP